MKLGTLATTAAILATLGAAGTTQAQIRMRAGNWENTVVAANGRTATRNACLTPQMAAAANGPAATVKASTATAMTKVGGCSLTDFKIDGGTSDITSTCHGFVSHNVTTYHDGNSFETKAMVTSDGAVHTTLMKGRRIGDCTAGE